MSKEKSPLYKQCVTCQKWGGTRKASTYRDHVVYGSDEDKGECVGGVWNRQQKTATSSCNKWEKWGVLK
jgi:hypothetical protein